MSPLWGFGCLVYAAFYKHVAPLGLNAEKFATPASIGGVAARFFIRAICSIRLIRDSDKWDMPPCWG